MASWRFEAIGAPWSIETPEPLADDVREAVSRRIEQFDTAYSRYRDDSLVAQIEKQPGDYLFPEDSLELFDLYEQLYTATSGALNPLVGHALAHLGLDSSFRLAPSPGAAPAVPAFDQVLSRDGRTLRTLRPLSIDVGAAGKGYLVDIVARLLRDSGLNEWVVDASGDIHHRGERAESVGLEHPSDPSRVVAVASLSNQALAASAPNRRTWAPGVHHILDALTGQPTKSIRASWVVADSCALADGLATALFVSQPEDLAGHFDFEWAIVDAQGQMRHSAYFPGEVFS